VESNNLALRRTPGGGGPKPLRRNDAGDPPGAMQGGASFGNMLLQAIGAHRLPSSVRAGYRGTIVGRRYQLLSLTPNPCRRRLPMRCLPRLALRLP